MSTLEGHSVLHALHWRQRSRASLSVSLASPSAGRAPDITRRRALARPAGGVLLVAGDHVARAHRPAVGLAAGADARAHLDGAGEPALRREVEDGRLGLVRDGTRGRCGGSSPGSGAATTLPGFIRFVGVEGVLDRLEGGVDLGAEQLGVPDAAGQAVAVLAAHRAAELDDQVRDLARDRPQRARPPRASSR